MLQRLSSSLVKHKGVTLASYLNTVASFSPEAFGAVVGDPDVDSAPALISWFKYHRDKCRVTATPTDREDVNMYNMGGVALDMGQGTYYVRSTFVTEDCFNFKLLNPSLVAYGDFPQDSAVLDIKHVNGKRPIDNIVIQNPNIDGNWKAAMCIRVYGDYLKFTVWGGLLTRYIQYGLKTDVNGHRPHELNMSKTHLFQQPDWQAPYPEHVTGGAALYVDNYDNNFSDLIIGSQKGDVMQLLKGANTFVNCHFYPDQENDAGRGRVVIHSNSDIFNSCYFDGASLVSMNDGARFTVTSCHWLLARHGIAIDLQANPYQVKITDCRFRNTTGVSMQQSVIRMKTRAEGRTSRPDIQGNFVEGCTAISTVGREYFTLTSTEQQRVVTRDIPDHFLPASAVSIQEGASNNNDDTWLLKARLIDGNKVRIRPYNMNVGWGSTSTYTGPVVLTYNLTGDL